MAAQVPEALQGFADESGLAFPKPAGVWIDQQGRLRKIHYTVTMNTPGGATPTAVTVESTMELYDFGVPVHATPPPANQVEVIRRPGRGRCVLPAGLSGPASRASGRWA